MSGPPILILTGAAGGIGAAVARHLAGAGASIVATDIDAAGLDAVAGASPPGRIAACPGDICDPALSKRLIDTAIDRFGGITGIVNCSGWLRDARMTKMEPELFARLIRVNFGGPARLIDAALPHLRERGHGRIISVASRAWLGTFGSSGYSAAKGALTGLTRSLALAHADAGITVNCIAPGFIDTPMTQGMPAEIVERIVAAIPVNRAGTVDDICALISFLLGEDSGYITGQTILSCGGRSLSDPIAKREDRA